jgi:energy-coupling factor transporter ATP-binding protein EcfA2
MSTDNYRSEIRDSLVRELLEKVRKQNYATYLNSLRLERIRSFHGSQITFDFPVTALVGPNGGGKSTILNCSACIYSKDPQNIFRKSRVGDSDMDNWLIEFDVIDKNLNPKGSVRGSLAFNKNQWENSNSIKRPIKIFGVSRTVPAHENGQFPYRTKLSVHSSMKGRLSIFENDMTDARINNVKREAERILGKSLAEFRLLELTFTTARKKQRKTTRKKKVIIDGISYFTREPIPIEEHVDIEFGKEIRNTIYTYIGKYDDYQFSEFNFGSGEASVIRLVADIEALPDGSLILIEEIENGLHPLAVRRMVDYLMDVAKRKNIQTIFSTHSDYAIASLPSEAIWATVDGTLQQGKLSVEILRAVSGRIDKRLAIFVEDEFAQNWLTSILREMLPAQFEEIGIYPVFGDGNAVKTHTNHLSNPSIQFHSICYIDGDSKQKDDDKKGIFRLPGTMPESTVFDSVLGNLSENIALLTLACQRPLTRQDEVAKAVKSVSSTNRDPHLLFSQVGALLGFLPESTIRGAFLTIWIQENRDSSNFITAPIIEALQ